eukprot:COSAG01_NODE_1696_length_9461_cov_8.289010_10_plen_43_part_00
MISPRTRTVRSADTSAHHSHLVARYLVLKLPRRETGAHWERN